MAFVYSMHATKHLAAHHLAGHGLLSDSVQSDSGDWARETGMACSEWTQPIYVKFGLSQGLTKYLTA